MANNKVVYNNQTLIDLTGDDVTAADVAQGKIFHLPSGEQATGTASGGGGGDTLYDAYTQTGFTYENTDMTSIYAYMFAKSKLASLNTPNVLTVDQLAFYQCTALESISLPLCTSIGSQSFYGCSNLRTLDLPELVTFTGGNAFYNSGLTHINLPKLETTSFNTFTGCRSLQTAVLPSVIGALGSSIFQNCTSLASVKVGPITSIGTQAFRSCSACLEYDFTSCTVVPTITNVNVFTGINANAQIKVPASLEADWKAANYWSTYASHIVGV